MGQLFYVLEASEFRFCTLKGYVTIDLAGADGEDGANGVDGSDGANGTDGKDGATGAAGADGVNGKDGASCSVKTNTDGSKTISCTDKTTATVSDGQGCSVKTVAGEYELTCGTSPTVVVKNGVDGNDGKGCFANKSNDSLFVDCNGALDTIVDGNDGADGTNGINGTNCTLNDNGVGTITQTCGTSVVSWPKALCGTKAYEPSTHFCSGQTVIELCGTKAYEPSTHFCSGKTVIELCGTKAYEPSTHFCSGKSVIELCGTKTYGPSTHFCSGQSVVELCGTKTYEPSTHFCKNQVITENFQTYTEADITALGSDLPDYCKKLGNCGTLGDWRNGTEYRWTKIGNQIWMAENLNYATVSGSWCKSDADITAVTTNTSYCDTYGRVYNYSTAYSACPTGWKLPRVDEWTILEGYVDANNGTKGVGNSLKSTTGWIVSAGIVNSDDFGFSALPGGNYYPSIILNVGRDGEWWTATPNQGTMAYRWHMSSFMATASRGSTEQDNGISVRCLKDSN